MPIPGLILCAVSIAAGSIIAAYGFSMRSRAKGPSSGPGWCSSSCDPLPQTEDVLAPGFMEAEQSPELPGQSTRSDSFPDLTLSKPEGTSVASGRSFSVLNLIKAPLRVLQPKRGAEGGIVLDRPVATGILLDPRLEKEQAAGQ